MSYIQNGQNIQTGDQYENDFDLIENLFDGKTAWFSGNNYWGQGSRSNVGQSLIVGTSTVQFPHGVSWKQIETSIGGSTYGIRADGALIVMGAGQLGQLGLNEAYSNSAAYNNFTRGSRSSPVQLGANTNWKEISCSRYAVVAIKTDGTMWGWGFGQNGENGVASSTAGPARGGGGVPGEQPPQYFNNPSSPVQIGNNSDWNTISCGMRGCAAITANGTLYTWGKNNYGQLGLNLISTANSVYFSPSFGVVGIIPGSNWSQATVGAMHSAAIKTDGTLWTWGHAEYGKLGNNISGALGGDHRSSPMQVGSNTNWKKVFAGGHMIAAIKMDGTLWTWGKNDDGELGLNDTNDRSSPVQVGTEQNWKTVRIDQFSGNSIDGPFTANSGTQQAVVCALKNDGTLWTWGKNINVGEASRSSPVQITNASNYGIIDQNGYWKSITHACIQPDTIANFGYGDYGVIGTSLIKIENI